VRRSQDIPEGGAKAVCLVQPVRDEQRAPLLHGCVKKMADGILDLISPETSYQVVTRNMPEYPPPKTPLSRELLFLGPDENIVPSDIDLLVERATKRGYTMPSAFISSKPRAGINHKEYGVTSEGVAVFLHEALGAIGISPTEQSWSVKLTGGPDGDVCGNMLRILYRDYGDNVRVVGLADGTASAEDPNGIPMKELMRMVDASLPLNELDASTLSPQGKLIPADTAEGIAARNSLHNRVVADAFVPAGGRPATMNDANWRDFLTADGTPSAKVVVEGANLFLTPEARLNLFETCGLPVVKDSSANKCGVICSSLEIVSSMVCTADEFVSFKTDYVEQVITRLRELARLEAALLFREFARDNSVPLPALSERISTAILRVDYTLSSLLDTFSAEQQQRLWPLVSAQLPAAFAAAGFSKRLPQKLPWEYQSSSITAGLASRLVYREGLAFVEGLPEASLAKFALSYLQQEHRVRALADAVKASGQPYAADVESLLLRGGVRVAAESAATKPNEALSDATVVNVILPSLSDL